MRSSVTRGRPARHQALVGVVAMAVLTAGCPAKAALEKIRPVGAPKGLELLEGMGSP